MIVICDNEMVVDLYVSSIIKGVKNQPAGFCSVEMRQREQFVSIEITPILTPKNSVTLFSTLYSHYKHVFGGVCSFEWTLP